MRDCGTRLKRSDTKLVDRFLDAIFQKTILPSHVWYQSICNHLGLVVHVPNAEVPNISRRGCGDSAHPGTS
jgi:hypothetical protein